ncbi:MAG: ABC transporter substrate-binding protein [Betaproteobacteria bacterium]|nr:ABC transporter substrate-binding protein [Betaproteobacteria bacterium]
MICRRKFVKDMALAGAAGVLGIGRDALAAEPPPETRRIRLPVIGAYCLTPVYVAEALLRAEGFDDIQFAAPKPIPNVKFPLSDPGADIGINFAPISLLLIDSGYPYVILAGAHAGCIEVFAAQGIRALRDLKGKVVVVSGLGSGPRILLSTLLAYVGIHPERDIEWREERRLDEVARLLGAEKIGAFVGIPPEPQVLRERKVGHVILNTTTDRPWSQYFCCIVQANREFVRGHPVATRRALRAMLKAADLCAAEPERSVQVVVGRRPEIRAEHLLQMMKELPYRSWRQLSAEDSARFYALRLHELGMIKSDPKKLIAQGMDLRFVNQLKRELKA